MHSKKLTAKPANVTNDLTNLLLPATRDQHMTRIGCNVAASTGELQQSAAIVQNLLGNDRATRYNETVFNR